MPVQITPKGRAALRKHQILERVAQATESAWWAGFANLTTTERWLVVERLCDYVDGSVEPRARARRRR